MFLVRSCAGATTPQWVQVGVAVGFYSYSYETKSALL